MALPIFAITIFVSAFLLFLVQPLVGKLILPKLGGTPQVWNTCMVFFQSVLLLGYAYTHTVSTRFKLRQQLMIHSILLALPVVIMLLFPIYTTVVGDETSSGWTPPPGSNPILDTLGLLALIVGIPFFVVSTSAPLLQKWFGYSGHVTAKDPYFLYSVSNLGSLLSLFFYPALIEPLTFLQDQSNIWFGGYIVLAGCILYCAYTIFKLAPSDEQILASERAAVTEPPPSPEMPVPPAAPAAASTAVKSGPAPGGPRGGIQRKKGAKIAGVPEESRPSIAAPAHVATGANAPMTWWRRIRWVLLAAVPSSMMLGVTSYISTDLSPFPLLWIAPLALYLLSFIIVYEKAVKWTEKRYQIFGAPGYTLHQITLYVFQPLGILGLAYTIITGQHDPVIATFMTMLGFFANALACHGELAEDRPSTKHLTEYFLAMSVGGMVGGVFNGIIAPVVFQHGILEFYIVIVVACMVRPQYVPSGWFDELVLNAFPSLQAWMRNQGDEMAKSMGRPTPRTTYLFSLFLDIVFGVFILSLAYFLKSSDYVGKALQSMKVSGSTAAFLYRIAMYGIPMVFCFFFAGRPARMGLAIMGLLLATMYFAPDSRREPLTSRRTYFGLLRVMEGGTYPADDEERINMARKPIKDVDGEMRLPLYRYTSLLHGTTDHGQNFYYNESDSTDLSRLATTYYHRYGPVGWVMERDNWFKGKQNTFHADARLPVALIGDIMGAAGTGVPPLWNALTECWSEAPYATIGLGTGTMVSYARPFQHMTYYEIDEAIREYSLPEDGSDGYFTYLQGAIRRGVNLEVIMGDARQSLEPRREFKNLDNAFVFHGDFSKRSEKTLYRSYASAPYKKGNSVAPNRQKYYKAINVDAFSSDAIPVHLVTKQAIEIYLSKLRDDGVLCVHTSNRHMDLVRPVARIVMELSKESVARGEPEINCLVGKDSGSSEERGARRRSDTHFIGHTGSEYVMIFRGDHFSKYQSELEKKKEELLRNLKEATEKKDEQPAGKLAWLPSGHAPEGWQILNSPVIWYNPFTDHQSIKGGRYVKTPVKDTDALWTDNYSHILSVVRWHWPWE